jgi:hypothetical protein
MPRPVPAATTARARPGSLCAASLSRKSSLSASPLTAWAVASRSFSSDTFGIEKCAASSAAATRHGKFDTSQTPETMGPGIPKQAAAIGALTAARAAPRNSATSSAKVPYVALGKLARCSSREGAPPAAGASNNAMLVLVPPTSAARIRKEASATSAL